MRSELRAAYAKRITTSLLKTLVHTHSHTQCPGVYIYTKIWCQPACTHACKHTHLVHNIESFVWVHTDLLYRYKWWHTSDWCAILICSSEGNKPCFFYPQTYGFERNWKTYQCYMQKLLCVVLKNVLLFPKHISKSLKNDLNLQSSSSPLVLEYCVTVRANLIAHASCHPLCWFRLHGLSALSSYLFL